MMKLKTTANIDAIALAFPKFIRTNQGITLHCQDLVEQVRQGSEVKVFSVPEHIAATNAFLPSMLPYMKDPFRGSVERRILGPQDSSFDLEMRAVRRVLEVSDCSPQSIDLVVHAAFLGDNPVGGWSNIILDELGIQAQSWNIESACSGGVVALEMATQAVSLGMASQVLVIASCNYSRVVDPRDPLTWHIGDGASALLVSSRQDAGIIDRIAGNTASLRHEVTMVQNPKSQTVSGVQFSLTRNAGKMLYEQTETCLRTYWQKLCERNNIDVDDISAFVFPAVSAYHTTACARILGIDHERCVNTYVHYANMGPVTVLANLYHVLQKYSLQPGDKVLIFSFAGAASVQLTLWQWGSTKLAPDIDQQDTVEDPCWPTDR